MNFDSVLEIVSGISGLRVEDLKGFSRKIPLPQYRFLSWYFIKHDLGYSDEDIAAWSGRDRTTVSYGTHKISQAFKKPVIREIVEDYANLKHTYYEGH